MACCAERRDDDDKGLRSCIGGLLSGWADVDGTDPVVKGGLKRPGVYSEERSAETVRRHIAAGGDGPSLLLYSVCGGSTGSGSCSSSSGKPKVETRQRACHLPPNTLQGVPIETDCFVGQVLCMYGPSPQDPHGRPGPFGEYFSGRKRNWEFRVQGRFKRIPEGDMFVGIVLRDFNYNQAVASHSKMVKRAGMALVKYDVYLSWGDRCEAANKPDAELSHLVTNLAGWDQIIITPEGTAPPELTGELQDFGDAHGRNLERAKMGLATYSADVDDAFQRMSTTDTFTMCSWGVSQLVDPLHWEFKIGTYISMAHFMKDCPIHIAMYELPPDEAGSPQGERQHLESQKTYYLDFMFWSSLVECPSLPKRYIFEDAPEHLERFAASQCAPGARSETLPDVPGPAPAPARKLPTKPPQDGENPCLGGLRRWRSLFTSRRRSLPRATCSGDGAALLTTPQGTLRGG